MKQWIPNRTQALAYNAAVKEGFFNIDLLGGVRSGKTELSFQIAKAEALLQPGLRILVTRDTGPVLYSTTLKHFKGLLEKGLVIDELQKPNPWLKLATGSEIFFVAYEEIDITKAGGTEYGMIIMDEAQRMSFNQYAYFKGRLSQVKGTGIDRTGKEFQSEIKRRHMITTRNPAGRGWLWRLYRRDHPGAYDGTDPKYRAFILPTKENEKNLPATFFEEMADLPEKIRKRLLEADEEPMSGLVFENFNRDLHEIKKKDLPIPPHWPIFAGMDYGYRTPTVHIWFAVTEEGFIIGFKEYRQTMATIMQNAENIKTMTNQMMGRGLMFNRPKGGFIDSSTNFKDGKSLTGASVYEQLVEYGLNYLQPAHRLSMEDKVAKLANLLTPKKDLKTHPITGQYREEGWPRLMFTSDCEATIQEFEEWEWPRQRNELVDPNEKPESRNDHGIDATEYFATTYGDQKAPMNEIDQMIIDNDPVIKNRERIEKYLRKVTMAKKNAPGVFSEGKVF